MDKGVHDGHRERVKQEFLKNGFNENTPPHKILEMLLFYSIPRKDTNETAHLLIEECGSLPAVLEAERERLATQRAQHRRHRRFAWQPVLL